MKIMIIKIAEVNHFGFVNVILKDKKNKARLNFIKLYFLFSNTIFNFFSLLKLYIIS